MNPRFCGIRETISNTEQRHAGHMSFGWPRPLFGTGDAVPVEILQRTLFIRIGNEAGTAFKVDYQGKIYFVTARHLAAGIATDRCHDSNME